MFICKSCKEEVSNSKMFGLVIGQVGREKLVERNAINKPDVLAGILSGFRISCPECQKTNWEYKS